MPKKNKHKRTFKLSKWDQIAIVWAAAISAIVLIVLVVLSLRGH